MEILTISTISLLLVSAVSITVYVIGLLDVLRLKKELDELVYRQKEELGKLAQIHNDTQLLLPTFEQRIETLEFKLANSIPQQAKPFGRN